MKNEFDVIVIGAGHAGTEAALAAARMGCDTALMTLSKNDIGVLSCNPAIGGVGKGQLVKEIDALGGEMAKAVDFAGIQFRILNSSKGPAVHSSRAQIDRELYKEYFTKVFSETDRFTFLEAYVSDVIVEDGVVKGVKTKDNGHVFAKAVVITPGTFLNGLMHIGLENFSGGRMGDQAVSEMSVSLKKLGFKFLRFKTGTCARLDKNTIDYSVMEIQHGDKCPIPFSFSTEKQVRQQVACYVTYTNTKTHDIIRANMDRSPLYSGVIEGTGVRYCPSIEDKLMRFSDRDRHQIFIEPEGLNCDEIYPNGISTSLPEDVQLDMIHSIKGLENAKVLKIGYGIEHDVIEPTQMYPTLETKLVKNLYFAGQINGTTGYEEAAAQGLMAGINATLNIQGKEALILDRSTSYIGVLLDDLVTKGTFEPYRMFTSRVEYRLVLREDNADLRLGEIGHAVGLLSSFDYEVLIKKKALIESVLADFKQMRVRPTEKNNSVLQKYNVPLLDSNSPTIEEFLRRPEITIEIIKELFNKYDSLPYKVLKQVETQIKYSGYVSRQMLDIKKFKNLEKISIPEGIDYSDFSGLSIEIQEKLSKIRPVSLGQASRISGVTPPAIMLLMVHLKKEQTK